MDFEVDGPNFVKVVEADHCGAPSILQTNSK